jgi:hypothetical protein
MDLLVTIRNFSVDSSDLDDAVAMLATAKVVAAEYGAQSVPAPEWLTEKIGELSGEVKSRRRDYLERALKAQKLKLDAYKTREQKREDAAVEIARLEELLKG